MSIDRFDPESYEDFISKGRTVQQIAERQTSDHKQQLIETISDLETTMDNPEYDDSNHCFSRQLHEAKDELADILRSEKDDDAIGS